MKVAILGPLSVRSSCKIQATNGAGNLSSRPLRGLKGPRRGPFRPRRGPFGAVRKFATLQVGASGRQASCRRACWLGVQRSKRPVWRRRSTKGEKNNTHKVFCPSIPSPHPPTPLWGHQAWETSRPSPFPLPLRPTSTDLKGGWTTTSQISPDYPVSRFGLSSHSKKIKVSCSWGPSHSRKNMVRSF